MKADVGNYNANLASARRTLQGFKEDNLSLGGVIKNMTRTFTGYAAGLMSIGALAGKLHETVTEAVALAKAGEGIRNAFSRLNDPNLLKGLREATHGTVADVELMKAAVKFDDFKLPVSELGTMLAFAQKKAKDTGQSVDYMVDSIVTGLGRKSLMILDNLGLSATEVKDRMKETGDMTKAVGEIIREQMSKAGDYVETAADRAAQANVSMQNKMEELGRKFAPLEEASSSLWTSMKLGILDIVGGPLTSLLNKLTEAGRMMNAYGMMGGNAKVGRMTANLAGASEQNRQSLYQQQQENFWRYINPREQMIKDIRAWQSGERGDALSSRIGAITEKYGMLDATKIQAEVDAAKKMLSDYQAAAKQILNPIEQKIVPTVTDPKSGKSGKPEEILPVGSVAELNRQMQELRKEQSLVTNTGEWKAYEEQIRAVGNQIRELKGELGIESLRGLKGVSISDSIKPLTREDIIKKGQESIKNFKLPEQKESPKMLDSMNTMASGMSQLVSGMQQIGITIPQEIQSVIGILQGITTILTAIQTINSIKFWAGGGVVHANSGLLVPGNHFSGDMVPSMINSGELILNKAQQGNLASQLQAASMINGGGGGGHDYVSGQNIFLGTNNYLKGSGQGQLVTTRMLRQYGLIN
jgi:hypothetical protein